MHVERSEADRGSGARRGGSPELAIIGLGHVGLPLWLVFSAQTPCIGVDKNPNRIKEIEEVSSTLDEPLRAPLMARHQRAPEGDGHLLTTLDRPMRAILVAVECESEAALCGVIAEVLPWLEPGGVLMIASTCQPAWFAGVVAFLTGEGRRVGEDLYLAHVPERLMPGASALDEVQHLPRVIGGHTSACARAAVEHYARISLAIIEQVSLEEAALIKIAENAYRAINIVLANEIETVAHAYGMDAGRVMAIANTHPRVALHRPGAGAWGRCLPLAMELLAGEGSALARASHTLNARRPGELVERLLCELESAGVRIEEAAVVVAGLAYKKGQRDTREGAGTRMVKTLLERGVGAVRVCDPHVEFEMWRNELALDAMRVQVCSSLEEAIQGAHGVLVSVRHDAFDALLSDVEAMQARGDDASHPQMCAPAAWVFV